MHEEQWKQEQRKKKHTNKWHIQWRDEKNTRTESFHAVFHFPEFTLLRVVATVRQNERTNNSNSNDSSENPSTSFAVYFVRMGFIFCRISVVDDAFAALNDAHITMRVYDSRNFLSVSFSLGTAKRVCCTIAMVHICTHHHFCGKNMPHYSTTTESSCVCICCRNVHSFEEREKNTHTFSRIAEKLFRMIIENIQWSVSLIELNFCNGNVLHAAILMLWGFNSMGARYCWPFERMLAAWRFWYVHCAFMQPIQMVGRINDSEMRKIPHQRCRWRRRWRPFALDRLFHFGHYGHKHDIHIQFYENWLECSRLWWLHISRSVSI